VREFDAMFKDYIILSMIVFTWSGLPNNHDILKFTYNSLEMEAQHKYIPSFDKEDETDFGGCL